MVGLRNRSTWEPLLLKASCIKSCANGCSMGITAHLTYANADIESVEGVFIYPLGEKEVVVGFEAMIASRLVGVQIQSRGKLKDCCLDCCPGAGLEGNDVIKCCILALGHLILDEDLERTTFIVGTGVIGPMDIVSIVISTTLELPTLENGAIRIVYPTLLTPLVTGKMTPSKSESGGKCDETSCFGATSGKQDRIVHSQQQCAHAIFTSPAVNLAPYELNFQLLVRGACLLAGLESTTHALRADADPSAQSASATYITLAQEHPYDRHIEIILHLSEPHSPLVILERGRLSFNQYEQQICSRRDFIRCTRKDSEPERKVGEYSQKRYHKDILCSPVLMLNFCPDLLREPLEVYKATRELLFLIDRSGSMSAMVVALKSLPSGTMLNIVGFGTTIKPLFTSSKLCTDVSTNLLGALSWVYQQPMQRSYPRQVFIVTDGSISNVAKVLELVRRNLCAGRYGHLLHLKLVNLSPSLPQLIKSLKKAFEPVLTDVRIDWYLPENMEALLTPNEIPPLYPGNRLIGYCTLYDMTRKFPERFPLSSPVPETRTQAPVQVGHSSLTFTFANWTLLWLNSWLLSTVGVELDWSSDVRRRIQESSYIQEQYVLTRCSLSSERSLQTHSHSSGPVLDTRSLPQGLEKMPPPEQRSSLSRWADSAWQQDLSAKTPDNGTKKVRLIEINSTEGLFCNQESYCKNADSADQVKITAKPTFVPLCFSIFYNQNRCLDGDGLLFPASPMDWDSFTDPEYLFTAIPPDSPPPGQCRSLIHGVLSGRPVSWEVTVDLRHLWTPKSQDIEVDEGYGRGAAYWLLFLLTDALLSPNSCASLTISLFDVVLGSAKRYRTKAIQTSKHCNIICMYTAFTTTDSNPNKGLAGMDVQTTGVRLQLASGAFLLTEIYSDCVQIPLDRLKRASPYSLHRRSLSPAFRCTSPSAPSLSTTPKPPGAPSGHHVTFSPSLSISHFQSQNQADSGRGSETDIYERSTPEPVYLQGSSQLAQEDLEGSTWATAVALAWLEHQCAGYFMEWELVAAKADSWLHCQELPEGLDVAGLKGAARQLFLLLRHWDENIQLNMLCYNPNNM
uniref:von Willebrand factor A domain containing 5B2 n=1 Tax=Amphilophus citrinellus TaxID=61819 RepID=A0A3Q0R9S0_AMPCI